MTSIRLLPAIHIGGPGPSPRQYIRSLLRDGGSARFEGTGTAGGPERDAEPIADPGPEVPPPRALGVVPPPPSVPPRQPITLRWLSGLAAILVVVVLLGGFLVVVLLGGFLVVLFRLHDLASSCTTSVTLITDFPPGSAQPTSSPFGPNTAYDGPVILVGTLDGSVVASRTDTGAVVWHWGGCQAVDALVRSADIAYVASHPVSASHAVSRPMGDQMTRLTALRARDGTQLWQVTEPQLQGYTYIALDGDALVVASNEGDGTVYGLDARSGQALWTYTNTPGRTDLLIAATGGLTYIAGPSHGFTALDDRTGTTVWMDGGTIGPVVTLGTNGPTIVRASGRPLVYYYQLGLVSQDAPPRRTSPPSIVTFDASTGLVRDTLTVGRTGVPLWVTPDGTAYTARSNQLCALQIDGAVQLWCAPSLDAGTNHSLRLARASGVLCYSRITNGAREGSPGEVGALDNATGRPLWTWQGPADLYSASNSMSPACDQGAVYLATRHGLYAFQLSTGTLLWQTLASHDLSFIPPALAR